MSRTLPGFDEALAGLVAIPTVSSVDPDIDTSNLAFAETLGGWLADLDFSVEIMPVADRPGKVNLIAMLGSGSGGLVLSGHSDTVPYDASGWDHDPFHLVERDGRLYGLGTADMKGFFPVILEAVASLGNTPLQRPLCVLATCDEESTMSGARALVDTDRRLGRHALIGEPTGLKPVRLHKGILFESIRLIGQSGHSSDPALGRNAIDGMYRVLGALNAWREAMRAEQLDPLFAVPHPTLNYGCIHGGDNPNRICGRCELQIDIRFLPDMSPGEVRADLRRRVMESVDGSGLVVEFEPLFEGVPGMATAANAEIVRVAEELSGHTAGAVAFGTEGPYLNALDMQTVVLGPGDIDVAHRPNEYLARDRIEPMRILLERMIRHFCV